ncbi:TPM domain-containing protein [Hydromonas duriensis]|uniref:TLP18.3/Psb32/MOLO-1 phosphatase superfamily protein n=1 Tax=Hydromonas duriensis TaxID=1527608 RepID=A0A4R6Y8X8_9BURK|nr:TPM domain-containing protein [Hydromonas duriensis]TDR31877.1 TLP18.3/Psb32/MOLO-1 phosphatase superfamily protein [Hydromonas duriensis]
MKHFSPLNLTFFEHTNRLFRHWFTPSWRLKKLLSSHDLETIAQLIEASETHHTAEIAVALETRLPWSYLRRQACSRERAWSIFSKMQVWDTSDNNGVLLYFLLAERRIEIVADRACAQIIDEAQWNAWLHILYLAIQEKNLANGIQTVISELSAQLTLYFPQTEQNQKNLVSNRPHII